MYFSLLELHKISCFFSFFGKILTCFYRTANCLFLEYIQYSIFAGKMQTILRNEL